MKNTLLRLLLSLILSLSLYTACTLKAYASEETQSDHLVIVVDTSGNKLFTFCGDVSEGDEYISADNLLYRVISVSGNTGVAEFIGEEAMPDTSWMDTGTAQPVFSNIQTVSSPSDNRRLIAMYVTHSDESYIPSDGTQSIEGQGGIYDVARAFRDDLQALGIDVILDESTHLPHDSGAYRRSRRTAERLLQKMPDAIIDIHRDGIPDQSEYAATVDGKDISQVRLLVGRGNQNSGVNREFAKQIKAIADKAYPGLIKDIFIGKGTYNQDLSPNAILLEFGTHTISKDRVMASTDMMAHVVSTALFGPQTGSAHGGAQPESVKENKKGVSTGIAFLVFLVVAGIALFAFIQTGSGKGMKDKILRNTRELTGGLFGKKHDGDKS